MHNVSVFSYFHDSSFSQNIKIKQNLSVELPNFRTFELEARGRIKSLKDKSRVICSNFLSALPIQRYFFFTSKSFCSRNLSAYKGAYFCLITRKWLRVVPNGSYKSRLHWHFSLSVILCFRPIFHNVDTSSTYSYILECNFEIHK